LKKFFFKNISSFLNRQNRYLVEAHSYSNRSKKLEWNRLDLVRRASLDLAAEEIERHGIVGQVAEVGVFQGDFAKDLNAVFPHKPIYLFDTFSGFHHKDVEVEQKKGFSDGMQDFSETSVDLVRKKLPYPNQAHFRPGFFPQTAVGLEDESFCFVSLDTDLYEPIVEGLRFFYPRLSPGGFIFVHDYHNDQYPGVRAAVEEYAQGNPIAYFPIPDIGGSVIIRKPFG
jgi:O-methyltransferase